MIESSEPLEQGPNLAAMSPHICWPVERLILERVASRQEIETHYNFTDVVAGNEALDVWIRAQKEGQKK